MSGAINLTRDFSGLKAFINELDKNQPNYYKLLGELIQDAFLKEVVKRAPKDTGEYAKSWKKGKITISGSKIEIRVETPQGKLYLILEEEGSDPHEITGSPLAWGDGNFAMSVQHPGFAPIPHVQPAIRHIMDTLFAKLNDQALKQAFPNVFG